MKQIKNRIVLIGRVGQTPEIKSFESGKKKAAFSIAVNEVYYDDKGAKVQSTQWHKIAAWGKTAEFIEKYIGKGMKLAVDGKLSTRNYQDLEGKSRCMTEVMVSEILLLDEKIKEPTTP